MPRPLRQVRFDDGDDRFELVEVRPAPTLAAHVDRYAWWTEQATSFVARRELAGTTGVLIVNLDAPLEIVDARGQVHLLGPGEGFVGGAAQATSFSRSTGPMRGLHVHAPLPTLARLAGVPIADLANRVVPLSDLRGEEVRALAPRLADATGPEACWSVLDSFVAARLAASAPLAPELAHLLAGLSRGRRVQTLADDLGWSRKRLAARFADATGLEPRAFAGLARFERFATTLQTDPRMALAEAAAMAGYADQAHLTRETVRYAGLTPAALRRQLISQGRGVAA